MVMMQVLLDDKNYECLNDDGGGNQPLKIGLGCESDENVMWWKSDDHYDDNADAFDSNAGNDDDMMLS